MSRKNDKEKLLHIRRLWGIDQERGFRFPKVVSESGRGRSRQRRGHLAEGRPESRRNRRRRHLGGLRVQGWRLSGYKNRCVRTQNRPSPRRWGRRALVYCQKSGPRSLSRNRRAGGQERGEVRSAGLP